MDAVLNLKLHFEQNMIQHGLLPFKPQRTFTVVLSINKIQAIIKSVTLQRFKQSLNNFGSQTIPLFKKSDFMVYPNHKY